MYKVSSAWCLCAIKYYSSKYACVCSHWTTR